MSLSPWKIDDVVQIQRLLGLHPRELEVGSRLRSELYLIAERDRRLSTNSVENIRELIESTQSALDTWGASQITGELKSIDVDQEVKVEFDKTPTVGLQADYNTKLTYLKRELGFPWRELNRIPIA